MRQNKLLRQLEGRLEGPMVFLAFAWVALLIIEFVGGPREWLTNASHVIWAIFVVDFVLRLVLARGKLGYIGRNWLTLISLLVPALRIFRLARALRLAHATRGLRLLRLASSVNRSMRALMKSMEHKGAGYVVALTFIVTLTGAAGMYVFERDQFENYWDALWWTAMIVTTMGSESWPQTMEGRMLCLALAMYAFSVFGYVTAALASFFVERGHEPRAAKQPTVQEELAVLREEMARLRDALGKSEPPQQL